MLRSLKKCTFCGPEVPAVGKYFLPRHAGCESGWMAVCDTCAETFKVYHHIQYFEPPAVDGNACPHEWDKKSLVTQPGGYDAMICKKCGDLGRRGALGADVVPLSAIVGEAA
jgi:hypothetical protein